MPEQIQEIPQPARPEVVPETLSDKNPSKIILLIILGLIVVAGAVYAGINIGKKQISPSQIISQPTLVPTAIPQADETVYTEQSRSANWKTYTNSQYGYSVKYSPSLNPTEFSDDVYLNFISFENPSLPADKQLEEGFSISVRKTELDKEVEYHKWTVEGHILASLDKEENIIFQGYKGVRLEYKSDSEGVSPFAIVIINNGKNSYAIKSTPERIDQILSTFKFLD